MNAEIKIENIITEQPSNKIKKIQRNQFLSNNNKNFSNIKNIPSKKNKKKITSIHKIQKTDEINFNQLNNNNTNNNNKNVKIIKKSASLNKMPTKKSNEENSTPKSINPKYLEIKDIIPEKEKNFENYLFHGEKLIFNKTGLERGLRGKKDGFGFFGVFSVFHGKIVNDFKLNIKKNNLCNFNNNSSEEAIIYFSIYYDILIKSFCFSPIHKINYNNIINFDFELSIFKKLKTNLIKIKQNIILNFDENKDYLLCIQKDLNNLSLQIILININNPINIKNDDQNNCLNTNNNSESFISKSSLNINNKVVSIYSFDKLKGPYYIGICGDIKIDLNYNVYSVFYDLEEKIWKIRHNNGDKKDFWIMCEKRIIIKCNEEHIFKINNQQFIINCFS